jgi:hypothetical protein
VSRHRGEATPEPSYWTHDSSLFTGKVRGLGDEPVLVRGKLHLADEAYSKSDADLSIVPLTGKVGRCVYVKMKAYVLLPDVQLTIALYPRASPEGAIGEVVSSHEAPRQKEQVIGDGQAWYYPENHLIELWECELHPCFNAGYHDETRQVNLADPSMRGLWSGFETFLAGYFPDATQIVTTHSDPSYDTTEYHAFLTSLGYRSHATALAAWSKPLQRELAL